MGVLLMHPKFENEELPSDDSVVEWSVKALKLKREIDISKLLVEALQERELEFQDHTGYVVMDGLRLVPHFVECKANGPRDDLSFRTVSTINMINAEDLNGYEFFEYQHSMTNDVYKSFKTGFREWLDYEYPVAQSFVHGQAADGVAVQHVGGRKVYSGPVLNKGSDTAPSVFDDPAVLAHFVECLQPLAYSFVKIFVFRGAVDDVEIDVRVNGADYPAGADFIRQYVTANMAGEFLFKHYIGIC